MPRIQALVTRAQDEYDVPRYQAMSLGDGRQKEHRERKKMFNLCFKEKSHSENPPALVNSDLRTHLSQSQKRPG